VRRAYRFRAYPTSGQAPRLTQCLRDHQQLYNAALEERREAWRMCRVSIRYGQQSAQLKEIRAADPDQSRWSFSSQQATLRRLDKAFAAFYRRGKTGAKPGYPRFRSVDRWDSVEWPSDGDGCRWKPDTGRVYLHHHKTALTLVRECDVIALEDLRIANMTRSASGTLEEPGTNVAAKSGLNRSILDAGWGQFTVILAGKAEDAGRRVVLVNPTGTSISCHQCGAQCARPRQDTVICPEHGAMDADVNGARNIYSRAGLGSGQAAHAA